MQTDQSPKTETTSDGSEYYEHRGRNLITNLSLKVRTDVYDLFYEKFGSSSKILDMGATSEQQSREANFLETLYPHKERITAAGIEDASFLADKYPGLTFRKVEEGKPFPFGDGEFDVAFSHAVIEHIVRDEDRIFFLSELLRVSKAVFFTTPNKYFPIEPHTVTPLLHFACPPLFYWMLDRKILHKFYGRSNLRLLGEQDLRNLVGEVKTSSAEFHRIHLLGFTSNLVAIVRP
jgi:hypothetical protein